MIDTIKRIISKYNKALVLVNDEYNYLYDALDIFPITKDINDDYDLIIEHDLNSELISILNKKRIYKISIDIPSGINKENGLANENVFKTNLVVNNKNYNGLFLNDSLDYYDDIVNTKLLNKRKRNTNKSSYGKAVIIAGSKDYSGAALISLNALLSFKMGIGYQMIMIPNNIFDAFLLKNPEILLKGFSDDSNKIVFKEEEFFDVLKYDCIALGMGMGVSVELLKLIRYLLENYEGRLLLDADALNVIAKYNLNISKHKCMLVITPHLKEFSRLINKDITLCLENGINLAIEYAKKNNLVVVLKSNTTIITNGYELEINTRGNTGLAKAGSGDMLSGILLGLLAHKNLDIFDASYLASYVLGRAAELCIDNNEFSMIASDIIEYIPKALNEVIK